MAGQDRGGNDGMSGAAMWKIKQQCAQQIEAMPMNQPIQVVDTTPPKAPNALVDAVTVGGSADASQKPLVRHVIIRNLEKASRVLKFQLPTSGVFANKAPVGLCALFDGQSCAGEPGALAAEFCAKQFHLKLLECLSKLEPQQTSDNFIKAVLMQCMEELDSDLLASDQAINDGCGASVSLMIGDTLFVMQLGQCSAVLCEMVNGEPTPVLLGGEASAMGNPAERLRLQRAGTIVVGDDNIPRLRLPNGGLSPVSRSLGDRMWKGAAVGGIGLPLIKCEPTVQSVKLQGPLRQPYVLLCTSSVSVALTPQGLVDVARDFQAQPRAACGQIAFQALEASTGLQCAVVQVCFLPVPEDAGKKKEEAAPPAKKAKVGITSAGGTKSMRMRHILVKFRDADGKAPADPKVTPATRTRAEAEAVLRGAIQELRKDALNWRQKPKDVAQQIVLASPKFGALCRVLSECNSGKQGGSMCGDLGWITPEQRTAMGLTFKDVTDCLQPGGWSDITTSKQGLHLVQRLA